MYLIILHLPPTFLLFYIFLHLSSTQQGEDDARLRVDSYSCYKHPSWALHYMGTFVTKNKNEFSHSKLIYCRF